MIDNYCFCCGNKIKSEKLYEVCDLCFMHIRPEREKTGAFVGRRLSPQDRTYFAQHGKDCPYSGFRKEEM